MTHKTLTPWQLELLAQIQEAEANPHPSAAPRNSGSSAALAAYQIEQTERNRLSAQRDGLGLIVTVGPWWVKYEPSAQVIAGQVITVTADPFRSALIET